MAVFTHSTPCGRNEASPSDLNMKSAVEDTAMQLTPRHLSFLIVQPSAAWRIAVLSWSSFSSTFIVRCFSHCFFIPSSRFLPVAASTLQKFTSLACFSITDSSTEMQLNYRIHSFKSWKYPHLNWYFLPPASSTSFSLLACCLVSTGILVNSYFF